MYVLCVVVNEKNQYLLIQEAKSGCEQTWFFPAGYMEKNETIIQAGIRETIEEAGIHIQPLGFFIIDHVPAENWIRFTLLARPIGGNLKTTPDKHSLSAGWFTPESVNNLVLRDLCVKEFIFKHKTGDYTLLPIENYRVYS